MHRRQNRTLTKVRIVEMDWNMNERDIMAIFHIRESNRTDKVQKNPTNQMIRMQQQNNRQIRMCASV